MYKFKELHFDMMSYALWILAMGLLVALYLVLTLVVLPKYATPMLVPCAVMGAIFALALAVIDWFGFYIPQPIRLESLTTLNLTGVLVASLPFVLPYLFSMASAAISSALPMKLTLRSLMTFP